MNSYFNQIAVAFLMPWYLQRSRLGMSGFMPLPTEAEMVWFTPRKTGEINRWGATCVRIKLKHFCSFRLGNWTVRRFMVVAVGPVEHHWAKGPEQHIIHSANMRLVDGSPTKPLDLWSDHRAVHARLCLASAKQKLNMKNMRQTWPETKRCCEIPCFG